MLNEEEHYGKNREPIKTTIREAVDYWVKYQDESGLSVDWAEAEERCHADGPNVANPEIMWDWIRSYGVPFYDTFWSIKGMREYHHIYFIPQMTSSQSVRRSPRGSTD